MSFPRDLDEYSEAELRAELTRRAQVRSTGACDYCGRPVNAEPCRFPARHQTAAEPLERHAFVLMARGPDGLRGFDAVIAGPGVSATLGLDFQVHNKPDVAATTLNRYKQTFPRLFDEFEVVPVLLTVEVA